MRLEFVLIMTLLCLGGARGLAGSLYEDSSVWPEFVTLKPELSRELGIGEHHRGFLVRLISESVALVDFGRKGLLEVDVAGTDIPEQAARYKILEGGKPFANYPRWLGPPKMLKLEGSEIIRLEPADAAGWEALLFIYMDPSEATTAAVRDFIDSAGGRLEALGIVPVMIPLWKTNDTELYAWVKEQNLKVHFIFSYLNPSIRETLSHDPQEPLAIVLTDLNGKILAESVELDEGFLTELENNI